MKKVFEWAKAHKTQLIVVVVILVLAGVAYYYKDKIMPAITSDTTGKDEVKPDETKPATLRVNTAATKYPVRQVGTVQHRSFVNG